MRLIDADAYAKRLSALAKNAENNAMPMTAAQFKWTVDDMNGNAPTICEWISVRDRMPKTEQKVLVSIKTAYGNRYTTVAAHVGYHERNSESDGWSLECEIDWDEYDEENDWYWVPECWYEVNFVDDNTNWIIDKVDGEITHWMPLPEPPEVKQDGIQ